jgi:hypothetical protein
LDIKKLTFDESKLSDELNVPVLDDDLTKNKILLSIEKSKTELEIE